MVGQHNVSRHTYPPRRAATQKVDRAIRQIAVGIGGLVSTIIIGTVGYALMEQWSLLDALYMTIITITTTGFKEVHELSDSGRLLTLFLIVTGVGAIAYTSGRTVQLIVETQLFRRRRMNKQIASLSGHFIVCGYGRMGRYVCEELASHDAVFVVIEKDPEKQEALAEAGYQFVDGDATDDDALLEAGVRKAKGMVVVLPTDAENVFATLSAKALNPKMFVVARAVEEETESKLVKAGANRVVKPYETGGTRMAELLLRPGVIEFIDIVAREKSVDLTIEDIPVVDGSPLIATRLADSPIRQSLNIILVAINKATGNFIYNPTSSTLIEPGDRLIALGETNSLARLRAMASPE